MIIATVFENNKTQAVRLPVAVRFESSVKKVFVRVQGKERIITPIENTWDSFFLSLNSEATSDFMNERADRHSQSVF